MLPAVTPAQEADGEELYIFGYASLIWNPGFLFKKRLVGYVNGYERFMNVADRRYRGTEERPGYVATIERNEGRADCTITDSRVWGACYLVRRTKTVFTRLAMRERGYDLVSVSFCPKSGKDSFEARCYVATSRPGSPPPNELTLAKAILQAKGVNGPNVDYVRGVAEFMVNEVSLAELRKDSHLCTLLFLLDALAGPRFEKSMQKPSILPKSEAGQLESGCKTANKPSKLAVGRKQKAAPKISYRKLSFSVADRKVTAAAVWRQKNGPSLRHRHHTG